MKLTKSVVLGTLALLALACDRGNNIQREEAAGSVQSRDNWQGNAALDEEPGFREMSNDANQGTTQGTGTGAIVPSNGQDLNSNQDLNTNEGAGAAAGAAYDDEESASDVGAGAASSDELDDQSSDQWNKEDQGEFNEDSEAATGTGTGAGSGSSRDDNRYLDNTSSEADLNQQDRGIPIGKEPAYDNTSAEGDEDAQEDL